jgi:hypothetical protein
VQPQSTLQDFSPKPKARSLSDAEIILGVSKGTFYNLEKAGKLKLTRIGGRT